MNNTRIDLLPVKRERKDGGEDYVENKVFTQAVYDYVTALGESITKKSAEPMIPEYIGECFIKIATGLSKKPNFIRYSYRDEMVLDAVENCVRVVKRFNINAKTRSGKPNAFSYFTQICFFAFLRRIAREKRNHEIKQNYADHAGIDAFAAFSTEDSHDKGEIIVNRVRTKNDRFFAGEGNKKAMAKPKTKSVKSSSAADLSRF